MESNKLLRWHVPAVTTTAILLLLLMAAVIPVKTSPLFPTFRREISNSNCLSSLPRSALYDNSPDVSSLPNIFDRLLPNIMIERVPGTPGNVLVREFIKREMDSLTWTVEEDTFTENTPYGERIFSNIIATHNPAASKRVVMACHYDSKYMPGNVSFVGASDSAVPCSIMINEARQINHFVQNNQDVRDRDITLQLIFFDGEEAFVQWTSSDSMYGSRHLANLWAHTPDLNDPKSNKLTNIHVFILMDLIGTSDTRFVDYYRNTSKMFHQLVSIEHCLKSNNLTTKENAADIFSQFGEVQDVQDDHTPFYRRGVPVLHLISIPFPTVWHTVYDNLQSLDVGLINDLSQILHIFLVSVLYEV